MPVTVTTCLILAAIALWLWRQRVERSLAADRARRRLERLGRAAVRTQAAVALGRRPAPVAVRAGRPQGRPQG